MRLSIIVPATGPQSALDNSLVSVLENLPDQTEVLVPHHEEYEDPYDLGEEVTFVASPQAAPIGLLKAGIAASQAEFVHVLMNGVEVTAGWTEPVIERFERDSSLAAVSTTIRNSKQTKIAGIRYRGGGSASAVRASRRNKASVDGPCLEASFFRKSSIEILGELDEQLCIRQTNADMAARLKSCGLACEHESDSVVRGELSSLPSGYLSSRQLERVYRRHRPRMGRTAPLMHLMATAANVTRHGPSWGLITSTLGHCWGNLQARWSAETHWEPGDRESTILQFPNKNATADDRGAEDLSVEDRRAA